VARWGLDDGGREYGGRQIGGGGFSADDGGISDREWKLDRTHTKASHLLVGSHDLFIYWTARSFGHGPLLGLDKPLVLGGGETIVHQVDERIHGNAAIESSIHHIVLHRFSSSSSDAELGIHGHDPEIVHVRRPSESYPPHGRG